MVRLDNALVDNSIRQLVGAGVGQPGIVVCPQAQVWPRVVLILAMLVSCCYYARDHVVDSVERHVAVHCGQGESGPYGGVLAIPNQSVACG